MENYETAAEALNGLHSKGYTMDFSILQDQDCIYCHGSSHALSADEFMIDEVYRFEGDSDPGDEMIVYAISSEKFQIRGTLFNAFGLYADSNATKLVEKLRYRPSLKRKPIKRADGLIKLSREHHHALLLCWKIKQGLAKGIALSRIAAYTDWFYKNYLLQHFRSEEQHVFPLLDKNNPDLILAIDQHSKLKTLFEKDEKSKEDLVQIQVLLGEHIRFEERILFNVLQSQVTSEILTSIKDIAHKDKFIDNETDAFWK
ncbi:MAG: hemerythrin domain-containing protein [Bacteroidia bacterium]|nr:hemerythrin domain-containing protein [Bacteroidia bacterium]